MLKKISESTLSLISKELLESLKIKLPINEEELFILIDWFWEEECSMVQAKEANINIDNEPLVKITSAVSELNNANAKNFDLENLNNKLHELYRA